MTALERGLERFRDHACDVYCARFLAPYVTETQALLIGSEDEMKVAALCTGLLFVVMFAARVNAQGGPPPRPIPVTEIDTGASSGLAATGTPFGNGVTGQVVGLFVPAGGITNSMLAGSINPTKITGTAAILGANSFTGNQSITGNLSVSGDTSTNTLHLPDTANSSTGVLMLGGQRFLHNYGSVSTFVGRQAGNFSNTGFGNTGIGFDALASLSTGSENVAIGNNALPRSTTAGLNVAVGFESMFGNTTGIENIAIGFEAFHGNTTGSRNIAIGLLAGVSPTFGANGNSNIYIGEIHGAALEGESNAMRLGNPDECNNHSCVDKTFIAGIYGASPAAGIAVYVGADGQLGTLPSSRRFKDDIRDMADTTNNLLRLRPVTFHYKQGQSDGSHPLQYGLVAEEVAAVYPELVQYDPKTGEPNSVMYQYLTPMLLNEVQKEHAQIESLQQQIESLKQQLTDLATQTGRLRATTEAPQR
jgi:hypothetical protein